MVKRDPAGNFLTKLGRNDFMDMLGRVRVDAVNFETQVDAVYRNIDTTGSTMDKVAESWVETSKLFFKMVQEMAVLQATITEARLLPSPADKIADLQMIGDMLVSMSKVDHLALAASIERTDKDVHRLAAKELWQTNPAALKAVIATFTEVLREVEPPDRANLLPML